MNKVNLARLCEKPYEVEVFARAKPQRNEGILTVNNPRRQEVRDEQQ
jgi:hypothetical protein